MHITDTRALPFKEDCKIRVNFESRYGMWALQGVENKLWSERGFRYQELKKKYRMNPHLPFFLSQLGDDSAQGQERFVDECSFFPPFYIRGCFFRSSQIDQVQLRYSDCTGGLGPMRFGGAVSAFNNLRVKNSNSILAFESNFTIGSKRYKVKMHLQSERWNEIYYCVH